MKRQSIALKILRNISLLYWHIVLIFWRPVKLKSMLETGLCLSKPVWILTLQRENLQYIHLIASFAYQYDVGRINLFVFIFVGYVGEYLKQKRNKTILSEVLKVILVCSLSTPLCFD